MKWMSHEEKIFAVLTNDTICIFGDGALLKIVRNFQPLKAREKFLRKSEHRIEMLKYVCDKNNQSDLNLGASRGSEKYSGDFMKFL